MTASPITVPEDAMVDRLLDDYALGHHCSALPVVAHDGSVSRPRHHRPHSHDSPRPTRSDTARESRAPPRDVTIAAPDELLIDVLRRARTGGDGRVLVLSGGELVGIVSPTDVARAIQVLGTRHRATVKVALDLARTKRADYWEMVSLSATISTWTCTRGSTFSIKMRGGSIPKSRMSNVASPVSARVRASTGVIVMSFS